MHELSAATQILATNCCVCGRDLCDAKSVELGIGPVCRKRYFNRDNDIPLGDKGWERALGVLIQGGLPEHIRDSVLAARPDTRKAANIVVYWASAHHQHRDTVLACSAVVRYLGYTTLADKLERDRSDIRFETEGDLIHIICKRHEGFSRTLRRLNGRMVRPESGRFKCWAVPVRHKAALIVLVGVHFGGQKCFADGGIFTIDPHTWEEFEALLPKPKRAPQAAAPAPSGGPNLPAASAKGITTEDKGRFFILHTPFDWEFVQAIRGVRGRRYEGGDANSFPVNAKDAVAGLVAEHFGVSL